MVVRSKNEQEFLSFYLYMCLKTRQDEIYSRQQGTGQPHIYEKHICNFPIPIISLEKQKQLVNAARNATQKRVEAEKDENNFYRVSLEEIKAL